MGINDGGQLIFKMANVVARELDIMLDFITTKFTTDNPPTLTNNTKRSIDVDVSNVIHKLSYRHSGIYSYALVKDTAEFWEENFGYRMKPGRNPGQLANIYSIFRDDVELVISLLNLKCYI